MYICIRFYNQIGKFERAGKSKTEGEMHKILSF